MTQSHTGKYRALHAWLMSQEHEAVRMTFSEIEAILGFSLPPSSRNHLAHWYSYGGSAVGRAIQDAGWRARDVNLTAETLTLFRGPRTRSLADTLEERQIHPAIVELLLDLAQRRAVEPCSVDAQPLPLSAATDAYAATYVARSSLSIALDPEPARRVHRLHGFRIEPKTAATSYIHLSADQLADPRITSLASDLLDEAFDRADEGPRWERGLPDRAPVRGELCPRCYQEKSLDGVCGNCD